MALVQIMKGIPNERGNYKHEVKQDKRTNKQKSKQKQHETKEIENKNTIYDKNYINVKETSKTNNNMAAKFFLSSTFTLINLHFNK